MAEAPPVAVAIPPLLAQQLVVQAQECLDRLVCPISAEQLQDPVINMCVRVGETASHGAMALPVQCTECSLWQWQTQPQTGTGTRNDPRTASTRTGTMSMNAHHQRTAAALHKQLHLINGCYCQVRNHIQSAAHRRVPRVQARAWAAFGVPSDEAANEPRRVHTELSAAGLHP